MLFNSFRLLFILYWSRIDILKSSPRPLILIEQQKEIHLFKHYLPVQIMLNNFLLQKNKEKELYFFGNIYFCCCVRLFLVMKNGN